MNFIKKLFIADKVGDNGIYTPFNQNLVKGFREQNPNISFNEIRVPEIFENKIFNISKWHFNEGDQVKESDIILSLAGSSLSFEFETKSKGVIFFKTNPRKSLVPGDILCLIVTFPKGTNIKALTKN